MPLIRPGMKPPPKGFEQVREYLENFETEMDEAMHDIHLTSRNLTQKSDFGGSKPKNIAKIVHSKTRLIFNLFYKKHAISKEVLDYCMEMNLIDKGLVRRWQLSGYESLCCVQCVLESGLRHTNACACRVLSSQRRVSLQPNGCKTCGCFGCASGDFQNTEMMQNSDEVIFSNDLQKDSIAASNSVHLTGSEVGSQSDNNKNAISDVIDISAVTVNECDSKLTQQTICNTISEISTEKFKDTDNSDQLKKDNSISLEKDTSFLTSLSNEMIQTDLSDGIKDTKLGKSSELTHFSPQNLKRDREE